MALAARFDAAFLGAASPPSRETPLPRLPPKHPVSIGPRTTSSVHPRSPLRAMTNSHLRDVSNGVDLGVVLESKSMPNGNARIKTTLTTLEVRDGRVVRGRLSDRRGLYGVAVQHVDPFAS